MVTSLVQPTAVQAGTSWSVSLGPSSVTASTTNAVLFRVVNTGSTAADAPIGCITFTIPDAFDVTTVSVDSVTGGHTWGVNVVEGSPSVVTYQAAGAGDRIRAGQMPEEGVEGTINVVPTTLGNFSWDVVTYAGIDCSASLGSDKSMTMKVKAAGAPNTAPSPAADAYSVKHDATLVVASPGVLANDTDAEGDVLTVVLESGPANGSLDLGTWGEFTYTPTPGFSGTDTFTYRASDGYATSSVATVTITVSNATPAAAGDSADVQKNVLYEADTPGVLSNDSDADGDALTAVLVDDVDDGTLTLATDGSWSYDPDPGFVGTDSFTYRATDGIANSAPATVTLTVTNDAPVTTDDGYATHMNDPIIESSPGVLANDDDANGDALTADLISTTSSGLLVFFGDGSFTYTPGLFWTGTDTFTYRAWDGSAWSAPATVTIAVSNGPPTAVDDDATTVHDTSVGGNVLDNDLDPDDDPLVAGLVTDVASGTLVLDDDGAWTYTPDPGFVGTDSFTYRATDGQAVSGAATVSIDVTNATPVAGDDAATVHHGQTLTVAAPGVLADDSDADGDALTVDLASDVTNGTLSLAADGGYQYVPDPGFVGTDTFTYTATDGLVASAAATVSIDVTDSAPIAGDDTLSIPHDQVLVVPAPGVLADDADPDGDALTAVLLTGPSDGTLSGNVIGADGGFTYRPDPYFVGTDTFTYELSDGALTAIGTVTIEVTNATPVATDDALTAHHRGTAVGATPGVLGNDSDGDGDQLFAIALDDVDEGTLILEPDGSWAYTPAVGFVGTDSFTYTVTDGLATSAPATVTITVGDTAPDAVDDHWTVLHDRTLVVASPGVMGNDDDADDDPVVVAVATLPAHGTLTLAPEGGFTYVPNAGYVGADGFTYTLTDGPMSDSAMVTIDVINLAPIAVPDTYAVADGATATVAAAQGVLANDNDPNGDTLTAVRAAGPDHGTLHLLTDGSFTYTPDPGFAGSDSFTYRASDGIAVTPPVPVVIVVRLAPLPTPTPTPAPTSTPVVPSPSPSATPETSPTPSVEPSPSAVPSPSQGATPSPSAAPPSAAPPSTAPPSASPPDDGDTGDRWSIGGVGGDGTASGTDLPIANLTASLLGLFGQAFDWLVPGALVGMPGLLLLVAVLAQMFGALAWLPLVRRKIGGFGFNDGQLADIPRRG